jgi:hypothetical protein
MTISPVPKPAFAETQQIAEGITVTGRVCRLQRFLALGVSQACG